MARRDKPPERTTITPSGMVTEQRRNVSSNHEIAACLGFLSRPGDHMVVYLDRRDGSRIGGRLNSREQAEEILAQFRRTIDATWPGSLPR